MAESYEMNKKEAVKPETEGAEKSLIEAAAPIGEQGRKLSPKTLEENRKFLQELREKKAIKEKIAGGKLISQQEAVLLRESELKSKEKAEEIIATTHGERPLTPEQEANNAAVEAKTRAQAIAEGLDPDGTYAENRARMIKYRERFVTEGLDPHAPYKENIAILMKKDREKAEKKPEVESRKEGEEAVVGKGEAKEAPEKKETAEIFPDADNRSFFEKLSDKTKEFTIDLYKGAKENTVDRARIMFNDKKFGSHHGKASMLKFKLEGKQKEIERLIERKEGYDVDMEKIKKSGLPFDVKSLSKANSHKEELEREIGKEGVSADKIKAKLEFRNQKKGVYETKRNRICENIIDRMKEKLEPYEKKLGDLRGQKEKLTSEIGDFKTKQRENAGKIRKLEQEIKEYSFRADRKRGRAAIKELQRKINKNEKHINKREKEEARIGHQIAKTDYKASPWRNKEKEIWLIMHPKIMETAVSEREKSTTESRPDGVEEEVEKAGGEEKKKEVEKEPEFTISDFIEVWNRYFGSELSLSVKGMEKVLPENYDSAKKMGLGAFIEDLDEYYFRLSRKRGINKKFKEKDFKKDVKTFRDFIKEKSN